MMIDRIAKQRLLISEAMPEHPWLAPVFMRLNAEYRRLEAEMKGDAVAIARAMSMDKMP